MVNQWDAAVGVKAALTQACVIAEKERLINIIQSPEFETQGLIALCFFNALDFHHKSVQRKNN